MKKNDDGIFAEILKSQLKRYPASTAIIMGMGPVPQDAIPEGKYKSLLAIDASKQAIIIPNLIQSDLLITNLLLEKMGYDFFINIVAKTRPQFICCSFNSSNPAGISEDGLVTRLQEISYDLFSRNEISLSNGKTLIQLDFTVASTGFAAGVPAKSQYKVRGKELTSLSVYNVGFQKCEPLYQWGPGVRDHYLIHYIISGMGTYIVGEKEFRLSAGDCFICYPDTEISYYADVLHPWEYAWIGFNGPDAALILGSTDFTRDAPYIRQSHHGQELQTAIRSIYDSRGNGFTNTIQMTGQLYQLLALFVEDSVKDPLQTVAQMYVQKATEYIAENYSYPISIEDVAAYIGVSRSQLFRCFQSVLGTSPKEYLTEYRIKQACHLLTETSFSMNAIANSLGFDNSLYFSKAFHKAQGMSPSEYRNSKR